MRIYVASSWRNVYQPGVVNALRLDGYEAYDFKGAGDGWGEKGPGPGGFGWGEVEPGWKADNQDVKQYLRALDHPRAKQGFERDMGALEMADCTVMVMPCGVSAAMEMGWACGAGQFVAVYMPGMREWDLMVKMADLITDNLEVVREAIGKLAGREVEI